MLNQITVKKKQADIYIVRDKKTSIGWADIIIDDQFQKGRLSVSSDYGSWSSYWSSCGKPFKEFLQDLNLEYLADKFNEDRSFNFDKTIERAKANIIQARKNEDFSGREARTYFDEINEIKESCPENWQNYQHEYFNTDVCKKISIDPVFEISYLFKQFWSQAWQPFITVLKQEQ